MFYLAAAARQDRKDNMEITKVKSIRSLDHSKNFHVRFDEPIELSIMLDDGGTVDGRTAPSQDQELEAIKYRKIIKNIYAELSELNMQIGRALNLVKDET